MAGSKRRSRILHKKEPFLTPTCQRLWGQAVSHISNAPAVGSSLEFETTIQFLFILLEIEYNHVTLSVAYASAIDDESLSGLMDRLAHEAVKIVSA